MNKEKLHIIRSRILWTLAMAGIAFLLVASIQYKAGTEVEHVVIAIKPIKGDNNLIDAEDVKQKFKTYLGYEIDQAEIDDLNLMELESLLNEDQRVKLSHLFIDGQNRLNIWILQRQPVVRVIDGTTDSYYIDDEGYRLDVLAGKAIRVPVATGYIEIYQDTLLSKPNGSRLKAVHDIAKYIMEDDLLYAMIEQIDIEPNHEIVLVPKIGRNEVTMGDSRDLEEKFDNLKIFYKEGFPREGWRKYSVLKVNWDSQVVGVLRK